MADYHIRLTPGTNVAVLNMMLYFIVKSKLYKKDFVDNRTEGFDKFFEHLNNLDIDHLAKVAGVDKQQVKEAAIAYATAKNSMEFHGLGVTYHTYIHESTKPSHPATYHIYIHESTKPSHPAT